MNERWIGRNPVAATDLCIHRAVHLVRTTCVLTRRQQFKVCGDHGLFDNTGGVYLSDVHNGPVSILLSKTIPHGLKLLAHWRGWVEEIDKMVAHLYVALPVSLKNAYISGSGKKTENALDRVSWLDAIVLGLPLRK